MASVEPEIALMIFDDRANSIAGAIVQFIHIIARQPVEAFPS